MQNAVINSKQVRGRSFPSCLLIGCSDNTSAANFGTISSDTLFHDNMANLCATADMNFLSVIHYAIETRKVESIIISGHYDCRSIRVALGKGQSALIASWLRPIVDLASKYQQLLDGILEESGRLNALSELNVIEQVTAVCRIPVVRDVRKTSNGLSVRGMIYDDKNSLGGGCDFLIRPGESIRSRTDEAIMDFHRRWGITLNGVRQGHG